ncbi:diguanylate cyclase [Rubellimicrobium rubrum]|nr:diguanylate cyclase [Rubellimicrobium rubrum]
MGGHVLIVDRDPVRRAALGADLAEVGKKTAECGHPSDLPGLVAACRPDLLLLDLDEDGAAAIEAMEQARARPGSPLPTLALTPLGRPDLRLAALRAGAEDATSRGMAARLLQARVRSLLRGREASVDLGGPEEQALSLSGLSEEPAAFVAAPAPWRPAPTRVAVLSALRGASLPPGALAPLLGCEVTSLPLVTGLPTRLSPDLVVIDVSGMRGDLAQGARVLALLAELKGHADTRNAATLVLLPAEAIETAALALDLGAGDVVVGPVLLDEVAERARALLSRRAVAERFRAQIRRHLRAAVTDPLTGLHNLHHADPALRRMAEAMGQSGQGLAVMMLDIDHFKSINDRLGHAAGDRVLTEVARRLKARLRKGDLLARVGGEEFRAALPGCTPERARAIAEDLRQAVAARPFAVGPGRPSVSRRAVAAVGARASAPVAPAAKPTPGPATLTVTLSIGIATASAEDVAAGLSLPQLVARADAALYAAKDAGRNTVVLAPSGP